MHSGRTLWAPLHMECTQRNITRRRNDISTSGASNHTMRQQNIHANVKTAHHLRHAGWASRHHTVSSMNCTDWPPDVAAPMAPPVAGIDIDEHCRQCRHHAPAHPVGGRAAGTHTADHTLQVGTCWERTHPPPSTRRQYSHSLSRMNTGAEPTGSRRHSHAVGAS